MSSTNKYQVLITQLQKNDPKLVHLDFEDIALTILQLEEIASKIQNNDFIGNVNWGSMPKLSDDLVEKIESKIILNNQNYKQYPNDFVHGLLSLHSYIDSTVVAYINEKKKQLVLAHRGITFEGWDLLKTDSPIKTHLKSILGGQIVAQQAASYQATNHRIC